MLYTFDKVNYYVGLFTNYAWSLNFKARNKGKKR